jgi:hypothetical protein
MINKIRPQVQRTFSPRSFMGDRGIHIDTLGKVRSDTMLEDDKIIAPKPWKACKSPIVQRSYSWYGSYTIFLCCYMITTNTLLASTLIIINFNDAPLL